MDYHNQLNNALDDIVSQGQEPKQGDKPKQHLVNGESIPCKIGGVYDHDNSYTRCELCDAEFDEFMDGYEDMGSDDPHWLDSLDNPKPEDTMHPWLLK